MTNFNFLSNLVAENEVNRALATAKTLQNAGGGYFAKADISVC